jgi:predicted kinase
MTSLRRTLAMSIKEPIMAKITFICGFIGSGKTTYATELAAKEKAYRYSADEWMIPLYGEHMEREVFDQRLDTLQGLFKQSALQLLELDVSVIFDFGFWNKSERDHYREWARQHGLDYEFIYLDVPFDVCCDRAYSRNKALNDKAYEMTPEMMEMFWSWFETPKDSEIVTRVEQD